jgi:hypothetical protein
MAPTDKQSNFSVRGKSNATLGALNKAASIYDIYYRKIPG